MWGPLRLIVFSLSTQTALGQLQHRVLGIRHFKADGSVVFKPSGGGADSDFTVSLQTAKNAGIGEKENAGGSLALLPQGGGGGDVSVQGFDHGRALFGGFCAVVVAITAVVALVTAVVTLVIQLTKDDDPPVSVTVNINIEQSGSGTITIPVSPDFLNDDGTDICPTCGIEVEAGECLENCAGYDKDATNAGLQTEVLEITGDPHMTGMLGQKFDWSGEDKGWYSLVSDGEDFQLNVRVTAPMPEEFPDRQLVSAVSILSPGGRSFVIEVKNPYTIDTTGCESDGDDGSSLLCLANGAFHFIVDGEEYRGLQMPGQAVALPGDRFVSSANLPAECRRFGGDRIWAAQYADMMIQQAQRSLRGYEEEESFEEWVLREGNMAAPTWCAKFLEEEGLLGLLAVQSNHAIFHVVTPAASLRINFGVNHQDRVTSEDGVTVLVPELEFWQGDVGVERSSFSETVSGMLGETSRPVLNEDGLPVMEGIGAIRGTPEDYRVDGPLGVEFERLRR